MSERLITFRFLTISLSVLLLTFIFGSLLIKFYNSITWELKIRELVDVRAEKKEQDLILSTHLDL